MTTHKYIGPTNPVFKPEELVHLNTQYMRGKIYSEGKYLPDNRVMAWVSESFTHVKFYKVYESDAEIAKHFEKI
jgi:hypothetical protein